ncbi:PfkB family carbohydrate kinase [Paraliomyxa miuraensis]|uniref:PfkB family carbohydrate kinase n=1 Tax=Paraliomyxa miuraensis TaxID=376150 RepID=UPI0022580BB4|nr:bifunctional hydroxymethylpyrimidine kinase/phosphomethylpyrimidine kinase [Paraliomyxa miuraensis]MCX4246391.1 PfkB family carbohydrate kinase [Paraliomyxa miuraensis]
MSLWILGGLDPTRGAGLHRDLVTARVRAPGLRRCFAVTALTEQGHGQPARAWAVPASRLRARVRRWPRPLAIKVGLVPDELAATVAELVGPASELGVPVVVDPVLRASDGGRLGASPEGLAPLLAVATLVTPNLHEARALVGGGLGEAPKREEALAAALGRRWPAALVLLKGGHGADPEQVVDRLIEGSNVTLLARPRLAGPDPRGTGCALATAIAAGLALGATLREAVGAAIAWLDEERTAWHEGPDGRAHLPDHGR